MYYHGKIVFDIRAGVFLSFFLFFAVVPHTREVVNSDIPATDYINYERASYETDQMPR